MIAADTNVVIRYLKRDDAAQAAKAQKRLDNEDFFISATVLLEVEWVLRKLYGETRENLVRALRGLAGLPHARLDEPEIIKQALDWLEGGMDFADALHLAKAASCDSFITFDRAMGKAAAKLGITGVKVL